MILDLHFDEDLINMLLQISDSNRVSDSLLCFFIPGKIGYFKQ